MPLANCDATNSCWTAGLTDSYIREFFLAKGYSVFTAPATLGWGVASGDADFGGFRDCEAPVLPAYMTINSIAGSC